MRLKRRTLLEGMLLGTAVTAAPGAVAHRSLSVLTTVEWSAEQKAIQVIHRIHAQDAEIAMAQASGGAVVDLTQLRDQARLMIYVEGKFALYSGETQLTLEAIGVELAGDDAIVYREARLPAPVDALEVEDRLLRDVFDQQTNLVNVRMSQGRVRTLVFAGQDGRKQARGLL
jgi:hypothetical protein